MDKTCKHTVATYKHLRTRTKCLAMLMKGVSEDQEIDDAKDDDHLLPATKERKMRLNW